MPAVRWRKEQGIAAGEVSDRIFKVVEKHAALAGPPSRHESVKISIFRDTGFTGFRF
jgi:hypothetical protein